ncbi:DUF2069 domain-containing protein [Acidovorax sp. 106]|uniref:DUF2069 domain-containing protein n=1 Tax=Acidovorax sp. 106 TaxID=2135637 RepID=UPI000EB4AF8E|nr:DUF2069 domain-containing protein [Acidovorax sp. 106]RLJ36662.1 putative membrane protein [Acidovorax sp. 106]
MTDTAHPAPLQAAPPEVAATRWVATASLIALIALCVAWELVLAPLRPGGTWLAIKALPLCIPLAGILKNRMYTYRWVSLVIWLYFTEGVVRAWSDKAPSNWLALAEVALCLVLFTACTLHVRLRQRNARALAATQESDSHTDPHTAQADSASASTAPTEPLARKD